MAPGATTRNITLKGTKEQCDELRKRIEEIIAAATASKMSTSSATRPQMQHAFVIKVQIPNDKVGIIIGKQGVTLRAIQDRTRATMQIPTQCDDDDPTMRTISIGADMKEDADAAQKEIFMLLQQQTQAQIMASAATTAPLQAVCIAIPDDKVGLLIGKGGITIRELKGRCKVNLLLPTSADPGSYPPTRTITIQGSPEGQMLARFEIENILGLTNAGGSIGGSVGFPPQQAASYGGWNQQVATSYDTYGQQQYNTQQYTQQAVIEPLAATPADPTSYYNDFWQYASYYGEAAARVYYTAWSPPEGTPPPPGIVLPASAVKVSAGAAPADSQPDPSTMTEEEKAAWDKYNKEYAEWQRAYSNTSGAEDAKE